MPSAVFRIVWANSILSGPMTSRMSFRIAQKSRFSFAMMEGLVVTPEMG